MQCTHIHGQHENTGMYFKGGFQYLSTCETHLIFKLIHVKYMWVHVKYRLGVFEVIQWVPFTFYRFIERPESPDQPTLSRQPHGATACTAGVCV